MYYICDIELESKSKPNNIIEANIMEFCKGKNRAYVTITEDLYDEERTTEIQLTATQCRKLGEHLIRMADELE